jgi:hypothetical protein
MLQILADVVLRALAAGAPLAFFLLCVRPALTWQRARPWAIAMTGVLAMLPAVSVLPRDVLEFPRWLVVVAWILLLVVWAQPRALVRVTGGERQLSRPVEGVIVGGARIAERLDVGALDDAEHVARGLDVHRDPSTAGIIDLWTQRVAEERQRRSGIEISSRETMLRLRDEVHSLLDPSPGWRAGRSIAAVVLVAVIGMGSAASDHRACIGVERLILLAGQPPSGGTLPLDRAIPGQLEAGASLALDEALGLERAAESRHDPATREILAASGFIAAHWRWWTAADGRALHADVFEFDTPAGAQAFHDAVNRYACSFATEAFDTPLGGIGLQVRWSEGDPIEEQVSWVVGKRRYLVGVRAVAPPVDHGRVLSLVDTTLDLSLR